MVEPQIVVLDVAGSSPVGHPTSELIAPFPNSDYSVVFGGVPTLTPLLRPVNFEL